MNTPSRRSELVTVGCSLALSAGCTTRETPGTRSDTETAPPPSPSATPTRSTEPTAVTPTDVERVDDFYIENLHGEPRTFDITVEADGDADPVITGRYRVPARTGVRFRDVGSEGASYDVVVSIADARRLTDTWHVRDCPNAYEGDRDGAVQLTEDGELRHVANQCDAIYVGHHVGTGSPEQYRVPPTEATE